MAEAAPLITIVAGSMTFVNQWYWTKNLDWKVPVATLILAAAMDGLSKLDSKSATMLSLMVLLGAATTEFDGHSITSTISIFLSNRAENPPKGTVSKAANR